MSIAPQTVRLTLDQLASRAAGLITGNDRFILGITGAPGSGKSTAARAITRKLGSQCAVVEMDGFHLANRELDRLGLRDRKGTADTFDADGYAALLRRLRAQSSTMYAPIFDRELDESVGSATPILPRTPLIVTEGNYLLMTDGVWPEVRNSLDAVWYLEVPVQTRTGRLVARHAHFGRSSEDAAAWVGRVDQPNAQAIEAVRSRADLIITLAPTSNV